MFVRRRGTKTEIANEIIPYFPRHDLYIELFFGAGGLFFNKPLVRKNILNDADDEIFNLFQVAETRKAELIAAIDRMPVSESLFKHWKTNKETDPLRKALRFLFLSNFSYLGASDTLRVDAQNNTKKILQEKLSRYQPPANTYFLCSDFRDVLRKISLKDEKSTAFIYADPPYIGTNANYAGFTEADTADLFRILVDSGIRFALSEFDHPFVLEQVKHYGLHLTKIGERRNVNNRRTEYLVTNYSLIPPQLTIFNTKII
jgi:DNA adenine methylase